MKIYVAGKFADRARVQNLIDLLIFNGHTITHDWTNDLETDAGFPTRHAVRDVEAIKECDVYIGLLDKDYPPIVGF